jgi:hypothetical protein
MSKREAINDALALVFNAIERLTEAFPNRAFTIDGRLVGDIGEVIAALEYDVVLDDISQANHDGKTSDGRNVQIKATFKDSLTFKTIPEYYLGFKLYEDGRHEEVFNGPGQIISDHFAHRSGIGTSLLSFPVSKLRDLSSTVPSHERIPLRSNVDVTVPLASRTAAMSHDEFFRQFVDLYRRARIPTFPAEGITRARCRSVSGGLEDLTAAYIVRNMPDQYQIFVDQPVSLGGRDVRYPDLVVCESRRRVVCSFLDVKTDLGWKRDEIKAMCDRLRELADAKAGSTIMLGSNRTTRMPYTVAERPSCHVVVGAWPNSGNTIPIDAITLARECGVEFYILSEGKHPNHYSGDLENTFDDLVIRSADMQRLLENIRVNSSSGAGLNLA